jgi:hypothetical protein
MEVRGEELGCGGRHWSMVSWLMNLVEVSCFLFSGSCSSRVRIIGARVTIEREKKVLIYLGRMDFRLAL